MRKKTLAIGIVIALLTAGSFAQAAPGSWRNPGYGHGPGYGSGNCRSGAGYGVSDLEWRLDRMSARLKLTPEQRSQVQAILREREEKIAPLRQQMFETRNQMRQMSFGANYDQTRVRELAARKADLQEEMMVARAETRSRIQALLTPVQQERMRQGLGMRQARRGGWCR